ncbi:MAG: hypothetical protein QMD76_03210 [Anaerosomatales bacterium]|nr:hypothetical protein [Coriobacteriia bacterium]MDI6692303.1 hypothetical protein [Anaerosomatales bacterium]
MTPADWECPSCGETNSTKRTGRARFCDDCKTARSLYRTTAANLRSGFNRTNKGSCELEMDIDEFCKWRKEQILKCHYCGITEAQIPQVRMKSQIQRDVRVMGVDRLDSSKGYTADNLAPCCFVCNQIKGDRFSEEEMKQIGAGITAVWEKRLEELG